VSGIFLPAARASQFAHRLWEHTCFEAFVADAQGGYYELNFSPSSQWAIYRFSGYRNDMSQVEVTQPPHIRMHLGDASISMDARIELAGIPLPRTDAAWKVALAVVIEESDGTHSYWALAHPSGRPDFHHPGSFAFELPPAPSSRGQQ
jgi:hypothetical protein